MKATIKISETKETEKEITLPYYTKSPAHVYCVYSPEECVSICTNKGNESTGIVHAALAFNYPEYEVITKEEFEATYERISNKIRLHAFCTTEKEERENKRIQKAGEYLCDDAYSVAEQVELIEQEHRNRPEERIYISTIEGVCEWEKIEGRLTAAEFLDIINS